MTHLASTYIPNSRETYQGGGKDPRYRKLNLTFNQSRILDYILSAQHDNEITKDELLDLFPQHSSRGQMKSIENYLCDLRSRLRLHYIILRPDRNIDREMKQQIIQKRDNGEFEDER